MKIAHAIISEHIFRGKTSGHINSVSHLIYGAKFYNSIKAFDALVRLCIGDIQKTKFDAIIPVNTRDSKYNLPYHLAKEIAEKLDIRFLNALSDKNSTCKPSVKGLKVLVFDDVIYKGTTMKKACASVRSAGAMTIHGFAIARSRSFDVNTQTFNKI